MNIISRKPAGTELDLADEDLNSARKQQRAIGQKLRGLFDNVVAEGVPDDFDHLLDRLEARERDAGAANDACEDEAGVRQAT